MTDRRPEVAQDLAERHKPRPGMNVVLTDDVLKAAAECRVSMNEAATALNTLSTGDQAEIRIEDMISRLRALNLKSSIRMGPFTGLQNPFLGAERAERMRDYHRYRPIQITGPPSTLGYMQMISEPFFRYPKLSRREKKRRIIRFPVVVRSGLAPTVLAEIKKIKQRDGWNRVARQVAWYHARKARRERHGN